MKTVDFGTIIHGTLLPEDLAEAFADEIERLSGNRPTYDTDDMESLILDIVEMSDALNEYAPPYGYFGSHPGDGSDFGFWPDMYRVEDLPKVSDPVELDTMPHEDTVFVSDHGNVTLYGWDEARGWFEVWAIV